MSKGYRLAFAAAVAAIVGIAAFVAATTDVPKSLPGVTLNSSTVFRFEVAFVLLALMYVTLLAFVLALNGRGFTKLGPGGVDADNLTAVDQSNQAIKELRKLQQNAAAATAEAIGQFDERLAAVEQRLMAAEAGSRR